MTEISKISMNVHINFINLCNTVHCTNALKSFKDIATAITNTQYKVGKLVMVKVWKDNGMQCFEAKSQTSRLPKWILKFKPNRKAFFDFALVFY